MRWVPLKLLFLALCGGIMLAFASCSSTHPMGLCTEMGACPEEEGCKDGGCDDDDAAPSKKQPWPSRSTGEMGGGDSSE